MRWWILLIAAILGLAFDTGFAGILSLRAVGSITPTLMPVLLAFVALFAPAQAALVAAWMLGLLVDLAPGEGQLPGGAHLIGPHAIGYLAAALIIVRVRTVVFRQQILTIAILAAGTVVVTGAVDAFLQLFRGFLPWTPPVSGAGMVALGQLLGTALYSGLLALPLGLLMVSTIGVWHFHAPSGRRATWR